mgnify:CR=1 FL=1
MDPQRWSLVADAVDGSVITRLLDAGFLPVVSPLSCDASGHLLNINADTVAVQVARALAARKLLLVSNVPGVLANKADPSTRIPRLTPALARACLRSARR